MTGVAANRLLLQQLEIDTSYDFDSPYENDEIRGEYITEILLATSQKLLSQTEVCDRLESTDITNFSITKAHSKGKGTHTPLTPIPKLSPKSGGNRVYELDLHQSLELPLINLKDLRKQRKGRNLPSLKLTTPVTTHKTS